MSASAELTQNDLISASGEMFSNRRLEKDNLDRCDVIFLTLIEKD
jgi:hypothetical protein